MHLSTLKRSYILPYQQQIKQWIKHTIQNTSLDLLLFILHIYLFYFLPGNTFISILFNFLYRSRVLFKGLLEPAPLGGYFCLNSVTFGAPLFSFVLSAKLVPH